MKLRTFSFLAIILFTFNGSLLAQSNTNYFIPTLFPNSPNTTAFAQYGKYPVNYFTGVPDISIPLYTVEAGGLKMPITLSYHASGIKISDVASWAGLGWSVNTGGSVTRTIMGLPDETGYLLGTLPNHTLNPMVNSDLDELYDIVNQGTDTRPDIFSYTIPGHSGNFFFDGKNKYQPQQLTRSPIGITKKIDFAHGNALSFTLNDESGNIFLLGQNYREVTTATTGGGAHYGATSAWMLEKIISQNRRDTISINYSKDSLSHPDAAFERCTITDQANIIDVNCGSFDNSGPTYNYFNNSPAMSEQLLQTILFRNGKVEFVLDTAVRKDVGGGSVYSGPNLYPLKTIRISIYNFATKSFEIQKTIQFFTSYFGTLAAKNLRLRLDSIQILDKAGSIVNHYRFKYNTTQLLPNYTSLSRDYWGYYNHKQDGTVPNGSPSGTLIPAITIDREDYLIDPPSYITIGSSVAHSRDVDTNYMQACMLDTIYYPTGGYTTLAYQTNRYIDTGGHSQLAGGLRVTTIKSYDGINSTPIVKTYQYGTGHPFFDVSGINPVNYGLFSNSSVDRLWGCVGFTCLSKKVCSTNRTRTFYAESSAPLEPIEGFPVGYSSITEYIGTPGTNVGKTVYTYDYLPDVKSDASGTGIYISIPKPYQRSNLLTKTDFIHSSNGTYQIAKLDSNVYTVFSETQYQDVGLAVGQFITNSGEVVRAYNGMYSPSDANGAFLAMSYTYTSDDNLIKSTITKIYDINDQTKFTTSTVNYVYGDTTRLQIAKIRHVDSKGNTHVTVNKYPFDYLSGSTTHNAVLDSMVSRHMYGSVVEKWDSLKNVTTSINSVTGAQLNIYKYGSFTGSVVPSTISTLSVSAPVTNFTPMTINSGNGAVISDSRYVQMIGFDAYDAKNNISQYKPRNATSTGVLWDYLYEYPVAQVKNAPPLNGVYTYYAYTGFEADSKNSWVYSGTPVTDLTAPTGNKVYPLSSGYINTPTLDNTKSYILSYWSTNGTPTVQYNSVTNTGTAMTTVGRWTYYEHVLPALGSGSYVMISGSASIDELRLHPADAQMTTYTYSPDGLTAMADTKGSISHFEYDYFDRLKNIKDFYGNIVNNYYYHTYDQTIGNDAMSHSYTRNNCPPNTNPGSLTYSVPVNKYYSSTKASANADASFEMATSGQAKANQNCGCPLIMVNVTLTNSTGISGFQATFNGVAPYNFPSTGSTVIQVPQGTYTTVSINPVGSATHTFKLTGYTNQVGHSASWSNVSVTTGSSLTLTVQ